MAPPPWRKDNTMLKFLQDFPRGGLVFWPLVFSLALTVLVCLVDFYRRPWHIARRVSRTLERWEIKNKLGVYPVLKRVRKNPHKEHELVLDFNGKGLDLIDFDNHREHWRAGLNGLVRMDYGDKDTIIRLYFLPRKYVKPTIITPNDNALGPISFDQLINLLIIGATGTGKTVTMKIIMAKISRVENSVTWLLDFKKLDFQQFTNSPHYYGYTDCLQGLKDYYTAFKAQQESGIVGAPNYLLIDEWGSFIMSLPRQEAEQAKSLLAELVMLGRGYKFFPIVGIQRPDSSYFQSARDNFQNVVALGNLSPEGRRMVFPDSVKEQITDCKKREGHLYIDGVGLEKIQIDQISDMDALDLSILEALDR